MGVREDKKAQARQAISHAATVLFLARGFDAVSVAEVADAAGVAKMTVFNYFPRKEDLFLDRGDEAIALARRAILDRTTDDPLDGVLALATRLAAETHSFAQWDADTERYFRVVRESPSLLARVRELREEVEAALASALLEAAGPRADAAVAEVLAVGLLAAYRAAHTTTMVAYRAGKPALAKLFVRTLTAALVPLRRAAAGTAFA